VTLIQFLHESCLLDCIACIQYIVMAYYVAGVCVCLCVGHMDNLCKTGEPFEKPFGDSSYGYICRFPMGRALLRQDACRHRRRIVTYLRMSTLRQLWANVPAQRTQQTNAFAAARGDKTRRRCGLLPNYSGQLFRLKIASHVPENDTICVSFCPYRSFLWSRQLRSSNEVST